MKRRIVLLVLSVLVAAMGTGLIAAYALKADSRAQAGQEVVKVLVANKLIPANTAGADLVTGEWVEFQDVPISAVPDNVLSSSMQTSALAALGKTQIPISPNQPLSRNFFAASKAAGASSGSANADFTELLLPLPGPDSAAGLVDIGDNVTVLITGKGARDSTNVLIESAQVVSINGSDGESAAVGSTAATGADSTVGLSVNLEDAQKITWAQSHDLLLKLVTETPAAKSAGPVGAGNMP